MSKEKSLPSFGGLTVAAFETRHAQEISSLIEHYGGVARVAPSLREVALEENGAAFKFGEKLLDGGLDAVIFTTGVGARTLMEVLETRHSRDSLVRALGKILVFARGPKSARVLRDYQVPATTVPEPFTWTQILQVLDGPPRDFSLAGSRIAIQEYGISNDDLLQELSARGVRVFPVPVYRWALPEDVGPLQTLLGEICAGRAPVIVFTSAVQVGHVMQIARETGMDEALRSAFGRSVVCSVGPFCTSAIKHHGIAVDLEPAQHKMGVVVYEAAERAPALLAGKERQRARGTGPGGRILTSVVEQQDTETSPIPPAWLHSRFMKACRREPVDATPVWLMRQAGRYLKEYRELRARIPFLELCKNPDLVAELTVGAAQRIGADAAILFADLLLIAEPMGFSVEYERSPGPRVQPVLREPEAFGRLPEVAPKDSLGYVFAAVGRARRALEPTKPLIGFAGAPFTLASYLIEGGPSKTFRHTKALMFRDRGAWRALMDYLARNLAAYVRGQIEAGVQAVQIFDSWVGCLAPSDYREFVQPHMIKFFRALPPGVPIIHFATGSGLFLDAMRDAGGEVIGLDFRTELDAAWERLGPQVAVQGNLDPVVLFSDLPFIRQRVRRILSQAGGRPGHIFNLGHGVLPDTPVEHVIDLVKIVHEESQLVASSFPSPPTAPAARQERENSGKLGVGEGLSRE